MDEITITDDAEFFVSSNKEVCVNQEVENNKNSSLDLDFDTSQQKIPPSVTIELSGQPTLDPEILSILSKYPHYVRPATLPEDIPFGIEVFFYPPMPWMDLNERLHCLDEYFRYDLPDILRTYPTTLIPSVEEDERFQYPKDPEPESPTLLNIESSNNPPESSIEHHLGNFHKPSRRIDICADFLRNLKISDFPFSTEQRKTFVAIDRIITCLRANYNQKDELSLKSELDLLMDLIASTDYPSVSQIRINRYVAALINELEFWIERAPITYTLIPGVNLFFVDPATYLINELRSIFPDSTEEAMDSAFFKKRKEIHVKLTQLLLTSKFPFTEQQKIYIREISQVVHSTIGNPDSEEEKEFQHVIGELLFDLCYIDTGFRDGISNPRKVRRAFNQFIDALLALGQEEKEFLREFDRYYINPADLIHSIIKALQGTFVLRHTFSHGSSLSESAVTSTDR